MSDDTAEFRKKFKYVMNQMFSNTNQDFTFNNFEKYNKAPELEYTGLYVIKARENHTISIVDDINYPEGPKMYKGKLIIDNEDFNSIDKFENKLDKSDDEILYIGKTNKSLQNRLTKYKNFGKEKENTTIRHSGGKRIWFIKDNKNNLVIDYITIDSLRDNFSNIYEKAEKLKDILDKLFKTGKLKKEKSLEEVIESGLIYLHYFGYGIEPFANEKKECEDIKNEWKEFWRDEYQID